MAEILIVEDNDLVRETYCLALESGGHVIREARDGDEGLAAAESGCPDLAILDLTMPGQDGLELARHLNTRWPDLPMLLITGDIYRARNLDPSNLPVAEVLVKPIKTDSFLAAVERALAG